MWGPDCFLFLLENGMGLLSLKWSESLLVVSKNKRQEMESLGSVFDQC